jgi:hypothetical protein
MEPERNAPCPCNSGKKYKKCCAKKQELRITYSDLPKEEAQGNFPPLLEEDQKKLDALHDKISEATSEDAPFFTFLAALREKYPENPAILNYLVGGYAHLGLDGKMYDAIKQMHDKFPTYLFGITAEALASLNKDDLARAEEVIGKYRNLKDLYPNRTVFHVSELSTFHHAKAQCACKAGDKKEALFHLSALEKALPVDDHMLVEVQAAINRLP